MEAEQLEDIAAAAGHPAGGQRCSLIRDSVLQVADSSGSALEMGRRGAEERGYKHLKCYSNATGGQRWIPPSCPPALLRVLLLLVLKPQCTLWAGQ